MQISNINCDILSGIGSFRVHPRFHRTDVGWNLGWTRKLPILSYNRPPWLAADIIGEVIEGEGMFQVSRGRKNMKKLFYDSCTWKLNLSGFCCHDTAGQHCTFQRVLFSFTVCLLKENLSLHCLSIESEVSFQWIVYSTVETSLKTVCPKRPPTLTDSHA